MIDANFIEISLRLTGVSLNRLFESVKQIEVGKHYWYYSKVT